MGYSHYYYLPKKIENFKELTKDVKEIIDYSEELGIAIGDAFGKPGSSPTINESVISINGRDDQAIGPWTTDEDISIPWPSKKTRDPDPDPIAKKTDGTWFAGDLLVSRCAPKGRNGLGSGSYETFAIRKVNEHPEWEVNREGLIFNCCKTAYRPYDLTVTAILIALKHHCPEAVIKSDGDLEDWAGGVRMCVELFGYGHDFTI